MTEKTPTDTDNQQADNEAAAARDATTRKTLREARDAGAGVVRNAMRGLARATSLETEEAAAQARTLNALTLSLGRIVDMDERLARKQTLSTADLDAARRAVDRMLALHPDEFRAALDAERAAVARETAQSAAPVAGAADVDGAGA